VMSKTFLKTATILSVYDFKNNKKILLGKFLFGIVDKDESNRFEPNFRIITSTIKSQNHLEFITKSNSCYVIDSQPEHFDISFVEFIVMRHRLYSPPEILEMRRAIQLNDDRTMH
jgi:hypothetical protein